jgi:hypothetical protein
MLEHVYDSELEIHLFLDMKGKYFPKHTMTWYLLTRRIIRGLRILYLDLLDITSGGVYNHL